MKLLIFIVNQKAGNGNGLKVWNKLKEELEKKKIYYRSFFTKYPNHAQELARQIGSMFDEKIDAVVAVGGDGTINEVVSGMVHYPNVKVAYIPAGSGNDFSRGFKVAKSPIDALSFILRNRASKGKLFDMGKCKVGGKSSSSYFVSSLGTGFDAAVSKLTNESKMKKYLNKIHLGSLAYVGALVRLLFTYRLTNVSLHIDGKDFQYENVWFVTISNQPYYGGGMKIAPKANTTDGFFDITVVYNLSRIKLLFIFVTVFLGAHTKFKEIAQHKGASIKVESDQKMLVHVDGELIGQNPVQVEVQHRKLLLLVK
ncbi:diacylglycerol/lipid kinase family protein [Bacillus sp. REN16]|uniref:diacylglycerol/lipid kinase family protein n=1 Tax=Bacillus sp. REN16 TaxID=2887296 RepID=UPI001E61EE55|nr:diacylglycerol kinase family protein [Bacillus sp. REN16]MCC3358002.1 diacylglycerol kinase family lipid kinase [Bacillus sp. REN16]